MKESRQNRNLRMCAVPCGPLKYPMICRQKDHDWPRRCSLADSTRIKNAKRRRDDCTTTARRHCAHLPPPCCPGVHTDGRLTEGCGLPPTETGLFLRCLASGRILSVGRPLWRHTLVQICWHEYAIFCKVLIPKPRENRLYKFQDLVVSYEKRLKVTLGGTGVILAWAVCTSQNYEPKAR